MSTAHYNPAQVGAMLGVHSNTVRLWCKEFAPFLSAAANPPRGTYRTFSADDLAVLRHVADMSRLQKMPLPAIAAALAQMPEEDLRAPVVDATESPVDTQEGLGRTESSLAVLGEVETRLGALPQAIVAELGPLLDAAWERGRSQGLAEGRRKVPPEYVLIAVTLGLLFAAVAALALNR